MNLMGNTIHGNDKYVNVEITLLPAGVDSVVIKKGTWHLTEKCTPKMSLTMSEISPQNCFLWLVVKTRILSLHDVFLIFYQIVCW